MATIGEANAAVTVLRWLGYRSQYESRSIPAPIPAPTIEDATAALILLGEKAGKALQLTYGADRIREAVAETADLLALGRLAAQRADELPRCANIDATGYRCQYGLHLGDHSTPEPLPYELLAAVRDRDVHMDQDGVSRHALTGEIGVDVSIPIANLQMRGLVELIVMPAPLDLWTLTDAGRRQLEAHDPSRCHYVNLSGRMCHRSGPHADWCHDFDEASHGA